jgi:SAM-dependent methyltransferase
MRPEDAQRRHYDQLASSYAEHYEDEGSLLYRQKYFDGPMLEGVDLEGREVLEAMCGSGQTTGSLLARGAKVTALDISQASIESFRSRWPECRTVCAPITGSGLPDSSFDVVVVVAGLHHLHPDLDGAMDEIHRLLKPGGTFCFVEPYRGSLPDVFRRAWYKLDPLFLANEAAIDIDHLREKNAARFEFVKEAYGGNVAYLLVLNSLVFRIPLGLKRLYTPLVLRLEELLTRLLGRRFACSVLGQWRKR